MVEFRNNLRPAILMFVDDNAADIEIVRQSFEAKRIHFVLEHYKTIDAAIIRLNDPAYPNPDIIFIDRMMNGGSMSGDDLIKRVRVKDKQKFATTKVIVLSGLEPTAADIRDFTEMDVDVFFPKPLQVDAIIGMIEKSEDYYFQIMRGIIRAAA